MILALYVLPSLTVSQFLEKKKVIGDYSILITSRSIKNFLSQTTSFVASQATTYLGSMVESAI